MKNDTTVDELLGLLDAVAHWFFWPYTCGMLEAADYWLDELLTRIIHSSRCQKLIQTFLARLDASRCGNAGSRKRPWRFGNSRPRTEGYSFPPAEHVRHQCQVLEMYAFHQAARAVELHSIRRGNRTLWLASEKRFGQKKRLFALSRMPGQAELEDPKYDPEHQLLRGLVALALAGVEHPQHPCLVLVERNRRLVKRDRDAIFHKAALLVGEPTASVLR